MQLQTALPDPAPVSAVPSPSIILGPHSSLGTVSSLLTFTVHPQSPELPWGPSPVHRTPPVRGAPLGLSPVCSPSPYTPSPRSSPGVRLQSAHLHRGLGDDAAEAVVDATRVRRLGPLVALLVRALRRGTPCRQTNRQTASAAPPHRHTAAPAAPESGVTRDRWPLSSDNQ